MLKLKGYGLRPWMEFQIDPRSGRYTKRRLKSEPTTLEGYAGFGQELAVSHFGTVLCAVFLHEQEMMLRLREFAWKLFQPGLEIAHREGFWHCELSVRDASGAATFRYRRKDSFLVIIDPAYDNLDFELANLPANLPSLASRKKDELVAEWSARARAP